MECKSKVLGIGRGKRSIKIYPEWNVNVLAL